MIIKNIIIAEDIRQEIGNKLSVMGIVGESINIDISHDAPKDVQIPVILASLVTIENNRKKSIDGFSMHVTMSLDEKDFAKMGATIGTNGHPRILHIPVPKFEFVVTGSAVLTINAKIMNGDKLISEGSNTLSVTINRLQSQP